MIKKIFQINLQQLQKPFLFGIFFLLSCQKIPQKDPFILSEIPQIQIYEKQDHAFCAEIKTDFDRGDLMTSKYYWRCRLSLAKYRISNGSDPFIKKSNLEISDLVTKISLKLSQSSEYILAHENSKMDSRHHKQCLEMGYEVETTNQTKIDDYFACRIALIYQYQDEPAFGNSEYLKYPNHSYNFSYVVSKKIDRDIENYQKQKNSYPECVKFNLYSNDFKNCTKAFDANRMCVAEIAKKKFLKDLEEKISCQKKSYQAFSDDMLIKEENIAEIERMRSSRSSDYYNNNSFAALGVDEKSFASESNSKMQTTNLDNQNSSDFDKEINKRADQIGEGIKDTAKKIDQKLNEKTEANNKKSSENNDGDKKSKNSSSDEKSSKEKLDAKKDKNFNTNKEIYTKAELTKLRQRYIFSCQKESEKRTEVFVQNLNLECEEKKKFRLVEEE